MGSDQQSEQRQWITNWETADSSGEKKSVVDSRLGVSGKPEPAEANPLVVVDLHSSEDESNKSVLDILVRSFDSERAFKVQQETKGQLHVSQDDEEELKVAPLQVSVLSEPPHVTIDGKAIRLTSQQLSVLVVLALHGQVSANELETAVWGGQRISQNRRIRLVSQVRSAVGDNYLPTISSGQFYQLANANCDVQVFDSYVDAATAAQTLTQVASCLEKAVALIKGRPLAPRQDKYWPWLLERNIAFGLEVRVVETALQLAEIQLGRGEWEKSLQAVRKGQLASPDDTLLCVAAVKALCSAGKRNIAIREVEQWERRMEAMYDDEPSPEPRSALRTATSGQ